MLGSVADAEDVVQDAWLRWSAADRGDVADERAYLVTITSRLALDRLRSARTPPGELRRAVAARAAADRAAVPAPPEATAEAAELGEQVSLAMLVVLETLSPAERAVFVLREVFGMPSRRWPRRWTAREAAVRQIAHRAREHVQARRPRFDADRASSAR